MFATYNLSEACEFRDEVRKIMGHGLQIPLVPIRAEDSVLVDFAYKKFSKKLDFPFFSELREIFPEITVKFIRNKIPEFFKENPYIFDPQLRERTHVPPGPDSHPRTTVDEPLPVPLMLRDS